DVDASGDDVPDRVVDGQAVGDVPSRAVDVESNRTVAVVGQIAQPFDAQPRGILLDVADQIDVTQPLARFLPQLLPHRIDQFGDQSIAQLTHRDNIIIAPRRTSALLIT